MSLPRYKATGYGDSQNPDAGKRQKQLAEKMNCVLDYLFHPAGMDALTKTREAAVLLCEHIAQHEEIELDGED